MGKRNELAILVALVVAITFTGWRGFTDLSAEKLVAKKVSLSSGAYDLNLEDLYLSNSPGVELKVKPLPNGEVTPYFLVQSNEGLFNVLQMRVNDRNKKIKINTKEGKQYKVSELSIEVYAPIKAVSCAGEFNIDVTSNSISDFSLKSGGKIGGTLNINASDSIKINSGGETKLELNCSANKLKCELSGEATLNAVNINTSDSVSIDSAGETELKLNGSTNKLKCELSGEATLSAESFEAHECELKLWGGGSVSVYADESLKVEAGGGWDGSYVGDPKNVDIDQEGESVFKKIYAANE